MRILIIVSMLFYALMAHAQYSTLHITVKPNKGRTILIDGKNYTADNKFRSGKKNEFTITDLNPGQHTITVTSQVGVEVVTSFTLFPSYDMTIQIERNGSFKIKEQRNVDYEVSTTANIKALDFTVLRNSVEKATYNSEKMFAVTNAFLNPNYHFTALNAVQLINLVSGDSNQLQLARLAYNSLIDTGSFYQVVNVFRDPVQRSDLLSFAARVQAMEHVVSMPENKFNALLSAIGTEKRVLDKDDAILAAFTKKGNRFSTWQASRLIELSGTENTRLSLSKAAFKTLTDPASFTQMYQLFNSQTSRNELAFFISIASPAALFRTNTHAQMTMTQEDFTTVLNKIIQTDPDQRKKEIANIFSSPYYLLSCKQISELLTQVPIEKDRLALLKSAYRITVDRHNFSSLTDLLTDKDSKDELVHYTATYLTR